MAITKGDVYEACLSKALEDHDMGRDLFNNPRISDVPSKVWDDALDYYDKVWPKLEAILDAPPLTERGNDGDEN